MRLVALTAALLAGTALAQGQDFSSGAAGASAGSGGSGGITADAGPRAIGTDAGLDTDGDAGVDPGLATTGDRGLGTEPGVLGTDALSATGEADGQVGETFRPGADAGFERIESPITDVSELPLGAGDDGEGDEAFRPGDGLDADRLDGPITDLSELPPGAGDDGSDQAADGFGDAGAPLADDEGVGTAGAVVLDPEGPVVVVPRPRLDAVGPADRLTEGVGGDVRPRMLEPGEPD